MFGAFMTLFLNADFTGLISENAVSEAEVLRACAGQPAQYGPGGHLVITVERPDSRFLLHLPPTSTSIRRTRLGRRDKISFSRAPAEFSCRSSSTAYFPALP